MHKLNIKALSVNRAWKGQRFKTADYKIYEKEVYFSLPNIKVPKTKLKIYLEFGFSSTKSDLDNPTKLFVDILQKKYGFNDSQVFQYILIKKLIKKGGEYIKFKIETYA